MSPVKLYFFNVLIALDSLGDALLGGYPGETISGRCGRARRHGLRIGTFFANSIDWVALHVFEQADHCEVALRHDQQGRKDEAIPVE